MFSKEILDERRKCITGTDIAAICGVSKWATPLSVFYDKLHLTDGIADNQYMEWGRRLEDCIASKYSEDTGRALKQGEFTRVGIFGGTPDRLAEDRVIEIKTCSYRGTNDWGEPGTDQIPPHYMCQIQWYQGLLDFDLADVCVLIGGNDYRVYHVKKNEKLLNILRSKANEFWEKHVLASVAPAASCGIDNRVLAAIHSTHNDRILDRESLREHAENLCRLKEEFSKITSQIDKLEAIFKGEIGDDLGVRGQGWSATWKKVADSKKTDWQAVARELRASDELIKQHTRTVDGYRRFAFKSAF